MFGRARGDGDEDCKVGSNISPAFLYFEEHPTVEVHLPLEPEREREREERERKRDGIWKCSAPTTDDCCHRVVEIRWWVEKDP